MVEKAEWEIVDAPAEQERARASAQTPRFMQALLGPWWRWKVAGMIALAALTLILVATFTAIMGVVVSVGAFVSVGIIKLREWLRGGKSTALDSAARDRHAGYEDGSGSLYTVRHGTYRK